VNSILLWVVVLVALGFDFTNGFHDTANAVATSVSTRALSPRLAVLVAAVANLAGAFVTTAVAKTVGKGIIDTGLANEKTVLAALIGAITWNLITWWLGLPSSSSHALMGGLAGAGIARAGFGVLVRQPKLTLPVLGVIPGLGEKWMLTLIFIVLAPLMGMVLGLGLMVAMSRILQKRAPRTV